MTDTFKTKGYRGKSENLPLIGEYSQLKFGKDWVDLSDRQKNSVRRCASKDPRYVKKTIRKKSKISDTNIDEEKPVERVEPGANNEGGV